MEKVEFKSQLMRFDSDLWHFHVPVPAEIGSRFTQGNDRRVLCTINGKERIQCALMPDGQGAFFINLNKQVRSKLKINEGDNVTIEMVKDESEYGMEMPEEFMEVLHQEKEAPHHFMALTPGKKRTMIHLVLKVKNQDLRIKKSLVIAAHLIEQNGQIDFKKLNEDFKAASQR